MKKIIRWVLNSVPRPIMQRMAGWTVPLLGLFYLGRGVQCPVCHCRRRRFLPYGYVTSRTNALCPNCLSLERHRLLWLYLTHECDIASLRPTLLHIAPEVSLIKPFRRIYSPQPHRYITADLESPLADIHFDVQNIPLDENYAEVIICNHILEHVEDDIKAMGELYRILKPGGWGVILSPIDYSRPTTFEDDSIVEPHERTKIFGQYDHRRIYGRDYAERLRSVGFEVQEIDYFATLPQSESTLYALMPETIYVVSKKLAPSPVATPNK